MARNKRSSEAKYDLADRAVALVSASMAVTRSIMAAKKDLAKNSTDDVAQDALNALEVTLSVLVEWGAELTEAVDKEYGRPTNDDHKEVRDMLHEVFHVPPVN